MLIQAWSITHPALTFAQQHDYDGFAAAELEARAELFNPPSGYLALLRISGRNPAAVKRRAELLAKRCREVIEHHRRAGERVFDEGVQVLGPVPSPMERINQRTRWQLLLRGRSRSPLRQVLHALRPLLGTEGRGGDETRASVDVDPQSFG